MKSVQTNNVISRLRHADLSPGGEKSKAFLFGLYLGLSLLLSLSWFAPSHDSKLNKATNIYGLQALAGAILGFWRIRKRAVNPKALPALVSVFICLGLAAWTIGQALWIFEVAFLGREIPYARPPDIFYLSSNLLWLVALVMIFKSLRRRTLPAISPFTKVLVPIAVSLLLTGLPTWFAAQFKPESFKTVEIALDFAYILLTFTSLLLAIGLVLGENSEIPFPLHQCIRYLCAASAIDAIAILAFTITEKLRPETLLGYNNGNWVDWLFLTAMYCWGVSALKWPIRQELHEYTFHTRRTGLRVEDIYRASDIAQEHSETAPLVDSDSIRWILDEISGCWRVVRLGQAVVGSTFLFPVPRHLMEEFRNAQTNEHETRERDLLEEVRTREREMFEKVKNIPISWDCLYLADASILPKHRRRALAFRSFSATIKSIASKHPNIEVYCLPTTIVRTRLAEKLQKHFEGKGVRVIVD